jgi:uncharacterized protein YndB with AHSA1/START domain
MATGENKFPSHRFRVSPEITFGASLASEVMRHWLFAIPTSEILQVEADPRVGGTFFILERLDNDEIDHSGEYGEIDRRAISSSRWRFPSISQA